MSPRSVVLRLRVCTSTQQVLATVLHTMAERCICQSPFRDGFVSALPDCRVSVSVSLLCLCVYPARVCVHWLLSCAAGGIASAPYQVAWTVTIYPSSFSRTINFYFNANSQHQFRGDVWHLSSPNGGGYLTAGNSYNVKVSFSNALCFDNYDWASMTINEMPF